MSRIKFSVLSPRIELGPCESPHSMFHFEKFDGRKISFKGRFEAARKKEIECSVSIFTFPPAGALEQDCAGFGYLFAEDRKGEVSFLTIAVGFPEHLWREAGSLLAGTAEFEFVLPTVSGEIPDGTNLPVTVPKLLFSPRQQPV